MISAYKNKMLVTLLSEQSLTFEGFFPVLFASIVVEGRFLF